MRTKLGYTPHCAHFDMYPFIAYDNRYIVRFLECADCGYRAMLSLEQKSMPYACVGCGYEWTYKTLRCPRCCKTGFVHRPRWPHNAPKQMAVKAMKSKRVYIPNLSKNGHLALPLVERLEKTHKYEKHGI